MIPILYPENAISLVSSNGSYSYSFPTSNGYGGLADAISCRVTEERNGLYELEMEYPVTGRRFNDLAEECYIKATHDDLGEAEFFKIYKITKPMNGSVTVSARHFSYMLSKVTVKPFTATGTLFASDVINRLRTNSVPAVGFTAYTDIDTTKAKFEVTEPSTFRSMLGGKEGSVLDNYHGEYEWKGAQIRLLSQRGQDSGIVLRYGKNITDLKETKDSSGIWSGIVPFWKGTDDNGATSLVMVDGDVVYGSPSGQRPFEMVIPVDLSSRFSSVPTKAQLLAAAQSYISNNIDLLVPASIDVSFVNLYQTEQYKNLAPLQRLRLCDTLTIKHEGLGIDYSAKIVSTTFDVLMDRYVSMTIGQTRTNLVETIQNAAESGLTDVVTTSIMQSEINRATKLIQGGAGGYLYINTDQDGKTHEAYFMDTPSVETATNVLRVNYQGIGFSTTGINGPYTTAWTINGHFVADFITTGTLNAALVNVTNLNASNVNTGILKILQKNQDGTPKLVNGQEQPLLYADADRGILKIVADEFSFRTGDTVESIAQDAADDAIGVYDDVVKGYLSTVQSQIDGQVEWWFINGSPNAQGVTPPSSSWTTTAEMNKHVDDICYDNLTGNIYKYVKSGSLYYWEKMDNAEIQAAMSAASHAQDTADGKRRNFVSQPTPPYDVGDIWMDGTDIKVCKTARQTGSYSSSDWEVKNSYTTTTHISNLMQARDAYWTNLDNVFNDLFGNGSRGWVTQTIDGHKYLFLNCDYLRGGTLKLGGATSSGNNYYGDGKLVVYSANGYMRFSAYNDGVKAYDSVGSILMSLADDHMAFVTKKSGDRGAIRVYLASAGNTSSPWFEMAYNHLCFMSIHSNDNKAHADIEYDRNGITFYGTAAVGEVKNDHVWLSDGNNSVIYNDDCIEYKLSSSRKFIEYFNRSFSGPGLTKAEFANYSDGFLFVCGGDASRVNSAIPSNAGYEFVYYNARLLFNNDFLCVKDDSTYSALQRKITPSYIASYRNYKRSDNVEALINLFVIETDSYGGAFFKAESVYNSYYNHTSNYQAFFRMGFNDLSVDGTYSSTPFLVYYVSFHEASDARLKTNIATSKGHMDKLRKLKVRSFDWTGELHAPGHVVAGLIAQEVMDVLPEIVCQDNNGYYNVNYIGLVPYLLDAMQEKDREIEELKSRVNDFEARLSRLEKLLGGDGT